MARIFISYATPDQTIADEVSGWLRVAGHQPFLDHDLRDGIRGGEDWEQRLYRELREVDAVITDWRLRWSPTPATERHCRYSPSPCTS